MPRSVNVCPRNRVRYRQGWLDEGHSLSKKPGALQSSETEGTLLLPKVRNL